MTTKKYTNEDIRAIVADSRAMSEAAGVVGDNPFVSIAEQLLEQAEAWEAAAEALWTCLRDYVNTWQCPESGDENDLADEDDLAALALLEVARALEPKETK